MSTESRRRPRGRSRTLLLAAIMGAVSLALVACDDDADDAAVAPGEAADPIAERGYADGARLVSAAWLEERLDDPSVIVVDLRNEEQYDEGHIPGARQVTPGEAFAAVDEQGVRGQIPPRDEMADVLGSIGVTADATVVLYDAGNNLWASRGLWVLDVHGHSNVVLLDGGWTAWEGDGREVSTTPPTVETTQYAWATDPNEQIIANFEEMLAAVDDPSSLICDARSAEEHIGRDVRSERGGHVPGAENVEWTRALNDRNEFLPADQLRSLYEDSGLLAESNQTVYVYCQTGVRAAHTWFVLHDLLGVESVKNYDGSWEEWGNREDSPIERS